MKTTSQKIDLHQVAIELLEHIRSYNKRAYLDDESVRIYTEMKFWGEVKRSKHRAEICRMVSARLTERYNKILKRL